MAEHLASDPALRGVRLRRGAGRDGRRRPGRHGRARLGGRAGAAVAAGNRRRFTMGEGGAAGSGRRCGGPKGRSAGGGARGSAGAGTLALSPGEAPPVLRVSARTGAGVEACGRRSRCGHCAGDRPRRRRRTAAAGPGNAGRGGSRRREPKATCRDCSTAGAAVELDAARAVAALLRLLADRP